MKKYLLFLFALATATACSEDDYTYGDKGAPVIETIIDPVSFEAITQAEIGQKILIAGRNLRSVSRIAVNDTEIPVEKATALANSLYFDIPRISRAESYTLTIENEYGKAGQQLEIIFPPLGITGLHNAWAPQGTQMTILGTSMDLYAVAGVSVVKFGDKEAKVTAVEESQITVTVPADAQHDSPVRFIVNDQLQIQSPVNYRGGEFFIENLEDKSKTRYPEWVVPNATFPAPLSPAPTEGAQYTRICHAKYSGTLNMVGNYNVTIPEEYFTTKADDYSLCFEVNTLEPIAYRLAVSLNQGTTWVGFGPATATTNPELMLSTGGEWQTFRIPMTQWKNKSGTKNLRIWIGSMPASVKYDFCLDNFRIEKNSVIAQ